MEFKIVYKKYRNDLKMWETCYQLWFIRYYNYCIFSRSGYISKTTLFKWRAKVADYFEFQKFPPIPKECYDNLIKGKHISELL